MRVQAVTPTATAPTIENAICHATDSMDSFATPSLTHLVDQRLTHYHVRDQGACLMPGVTPISEQRTGSNGWAIEELLHRGLDRLIRDLRVLEAGGFDEKICEQVREALYRLVQGADTATGASFAQEIIIESDRFRQHYVEWNGNGTNSNDSAIASRRNLIGDLFVWRSKMMEKLKARRRGYLSFATDDDFAVVSQVYDQLEEVVSKYPDTFFYLKRSVTKFKAAAKQRALLAA